jgi:glutamate racemase
MKIGVFDSGVGGLSVANAIQRALPGDEVILRDDRKHVPYGQRKPAEIFGFVVPIFQQLIDDGCQVIVVACNTVTTTLIGDLRKKFSLPLVAVEPMVKPAAALTKTGVIAVCATPTTLASPRYAQLKQEYAQGITVLEPDCSQWPAMIEERRLNLNHKAIDQMVTEVLAKGADVIVLACTHYHWIEVEIQNLSRGKATVLQPEQAIVAQLNRVIARLP